MLAVADLAEVLVPDGPFDAGAAEVAGESAAGAGHFVAAFGLEEALLAVGARADAGRGHGLRKSGREREGKGREGTTT